MSVSGAVSMFIGAAFWGVSETDLWQALADKDMETYQLQLADVKLLLVIINTCFWIIGVLFMGIAGTLISDFCISNSGLAQLAKVCMRSAALIAIVSFISMLSLSICPVFADVASLLGWIGTHLVDIATVLL